MKKTYFFKTIFLTIFLLTLGVSASGQTTTFFQFTGTSGYLATPATGWTSTGSEGGSYLKLSPGSVTSPEYNKATDLVFKYDIASFGSGSTSSETKLFVLDSSGSTIAEYTLTSANSSTYITNQTVNIGEITTNFKIKIEGLGTGANTSSVRGTRLRNYSLVGLEGSSTPTPTINVNPASLTFGDLDKNTTSEAKTVEVTASNLEGALSYEITGTNASEFNATGTLVSTGGTLNITFSPTSAGTKEAILTVTDGTISKTITLQGTGVVPLLETPMAIDNPTKSQTGFTAEWNAVAGATEYILNVYTKSTTDNGAEVIVLSENFDGFTAGSTGSGAHSSDISANLDNYAQNLGWTGSKIYQAGRSIKLGSASALGYITTPTIDLSANGGTFNLSFESMAWKDDATSIKIYLDDVLLYTVTDLNNDDSYTLKSYNTSLTGGTSTSQIKFEGLQASYSRFFLENIEITQGGSETTISPIAGSPFEGLTTTSYDVTGLNNDKTYYYTVVAKNADAISTPSNEVAVTLLTTGINDTELSTSRNIWTSEGKIQVNANAGEIIEVFNSTGQKLIHSVAVSGINSLSTSAKGVVVVKVGNHVAKVIL